MAEPILFQDIWKGDDDIKSLIYVIFALLLSPLIMWSQMTKVFAFETQLATDVVMVLDSSGSMQHADPDFLTLQASQLLLGQLDKAHSRVGFVIFEGEIDAVHPLVPISTQDDIDYLMNELNRLYHQNGNFTDVPRGLSRAIQLFGDSPSENRKVIFLLTDGNDAPFRSMYEVDSEREIVIETARDLGIQIFTIGLNADGSLDHQHIQRIASETGARWYEAINADQLAGFILDIYSYRLNPNATNMDIVTGTFPGGGAVENITVNIPDSYVANANINIQSAALTDVVIRDPDGSIVEEGDPRVYIDRMSSITIIQLIRPAKNDWTLSITGEENMPYEIRLLYAYDLSLGVSARSRDGSMAVVGDAWVDAMLQLNAQPVTDYDIYQSVIDVAFHITSDEGDFTFPGVLNGDVFTADISSLPEGQYYLEAAMTHSAFNRESEVISFTLTLPIAATSTVTPTPATPTVTPIPVVPSLPESSFNWMWLLVGLAAVPAVAAMAAVYKKSSLPPKQIHGDLKIVISNDESTVTGYNTGMFSSQALTKIDLPDVVEGAHSSKGSMYFESDQARAAAAKVKLKGADEGIVFISSDKTVKVNADEYYQNKPAWPFLDTSHSGSYGRIEIELNDSDSTNITITKR